MRVFVTGANGFIGGSVASRLIADGHDVRGLVRDRAKGEAARKFGVMPVVGTLDDRELLITEARRAEAVVNAASSDHRGAIDALVEALSGSGKTLLHTSGSSIVGDEAMGEPSDRVFDEATPLKPEPDKVARVALDRSVLDAPGIRSVVLCNTMIYGRGLGAEVDSDQVPALAKQARSSGVARFIGRGLNRWSNVHIADMADLYALALDKAAAGTFLYVESGEETLGNVVRAIGRRLGLGEAQPWPAADAMAAWGREKAVFGLGSNSRVRGRRGRDLGWNPKHRSVTAWIESELA